MGIRGLIRRRGSVWFSMRVVSMRTMNVCHPCLGMETAKLMKLMAQMNLDNGVRHAIDSGRIIWLHIDRW